MSEIDSSRLKSILSKTVGPTPWYWETFPAFRSPSGQQFEWTHHGAEGPVAHLVTLGLKQEPDQVRLALNTYCRPFLVPPNFIGIWCPEGRSIRLACFDPDQLKAFDVAEVAGWFKASSSASMRRPLLSQTSKFLWLWGRARTRLKFRRNYRRSTS